MKIQASIPPNIATYVKEYYKQNMAAKFTFQGIAEKNQIKFDPLLDSDVIHSIVGYFGPCFMGSLSFERFYAVFLAALMERPIIFVSNSKCKLTAALYSSLLIYLFSDSR